MRKSISRQLQSHIRRAIQAGAWLDGYTASPRGRWKPDTWVFAVRYAEYPYRPRKPLLYTKRFGYYAAAVELWMELRKRMETKPAKRKMGAAA